MDLHDHNQHMLQASPVIARLSPLRREKLIPTLLHDMSGNLLQDALAIVLFPVSQQSSNCAQPSSSLAAKIDRHLRLWVDRALPSPFKISDQAAVDQLLTFWLRVIQFVEDYLGKATHIYPPRAYHHLPSSTTDTGPGSFDICNLNHAERLRAMRGFFRYELLCKLRQPRPYNIVDAIPRLAARLRELTKIDSNIDIGTYGKMDPLQPYEDQKQSSLETELLKCVDEYFCCLYGALFARLSDSWIPNLPLTTVRRARGAGLIYPDNVCFDSFTFARDMSIFRSGSHNIPRFLASYGINLAVNFIHMLASGTLPSSWLRNSSNLVKNKNISQADTWFPYDARVNGWMYDRFRGPVWARVPGMPWLLAARLYHYEDAEDPDERDFEKNDFPREARLQLKMYRQRAWVFFDDWRFYPPSWTEHFPRHQTLRRMHEMSRKTYMAVDQESRLRRSRTWNETDASIRDILWANTKGPSDEEQREEAKLDVNMHPTDFLLPWLKSCWELP